MTERKKEGEDKLREQMSGRLVLPLIVMGKTASRLVGRREKLRFWF